MTVEILCKTILNNVFLSVWKKNLNLKLIVCFPRQGSYGTYLNLFLGLAMYCKRITLYIVCLQEFECARLNPGARTTDWPNNQFTVLQAKNYTYILWVTGTSCCCTQPGPIRILTRNLFGNVYSSLYIRVTSGKRIYVCVCYMYTIIIIKWK